MAWLPVTLYYISACPACRAAKDFLTSHQIPFTAIDVSFRENMEELRAKRGTMAEPLLVVGAEQVIGWDRDRVKTLLGI